MVDGVCRILSEGVVDSVDSLEKLRQLLCSSDLRYENQGRMLLLALSPLEQSQLVKDCSLRSSFFGKSSYRWSPSFQGWKDLDNSSQATSTMLELLVQYTSQPTEEIEHLSLSGFQCITNLDFVLGKFFF